MQVSSTHSSRRFVRINGDDFGFSTGVNQAIIAAHQQGILTSTSLMVTGEAVDEAIELAASNPSLAVGLHLVLGMGRSVLSPAQIPNLVDAEGNFPDDPGRAGLSYQFNAKARRELPLEIRAQLEKFRQTGLNLSHVDGHLHLHSHPVVLRHLVNLAEEFAIREIRLPSEELSIALKIDRSDWLTKTVGSLVFTGLRRDGEKLLKKHQIQFADRVYGFLQTGRITESYLLELIPKITADVIEIYSHPAIAIPGEPSNAPLSLGFAELEALLSDRVRATLKQHGFELIAGSD
ncbi:MAG: hopanoid biosynthesis associated protein HpnK [Leptolyngbya sp. ERB_1_2]